MSKPNNLREGDRVSLDIEMDDLQAGMTGTVVELVQYFDMQKECVAAVGRKCLGVKFDERHYPAVARRMSAQFTYVIEHCTRIQ
jgi:hypothetical protein